MQSKGDHETKSAARKRPHSPISSVDSVDCNEPEHKKLTMATGPSRNVRKRVEYTHSENRDIVQFIVDQRAYSDLKSVNVWKAMTRKCPNHSWESLKEHFMKKIWPYIDTYNISPEEKALFKKEKKGKGQKRKKGGCGPRVYSGREDAIILQAVRKYAPNRNGLGGNAFWQRMEDKNLLKGRSWSSMRERYNKHIKFNEEEVDQKANNSASDDSSSNDKRPSRQGNNDKNPEMMQESEDDLESTQNEEESKGMKHGNRVNGQMVGDDEEAEEERSRSERNGDVDGDRGKVKNMKRVLLPYKKSFFPDATPPLPEKQGFSMLTVLREARSKRMFAGTSSSPSCSPKRREAASSSKDPGSGRGGELVISQSPSENDVVSQDLFASCTSGEEEARIPSLPPPEPVATSTQLSLQNESLAPSLQLASKAGSMNRKQSSPPKINHLSPKRSLSPCSAVLATDTQTKATSPSPFKYDPSSKQPPLSSVNPFIISEWPSNYPPDVLHFVGDTDSEDDGENLENSNTVTVDIDTYSDWSDCELSWKGVRSQPIISPFLKTSKREKGKEGDPVTQDKIRLGNDLSPKGSDITFCNSKMSASGFGFHSGLTESDHACNVRQPNANSDVIGSQPQAKTASSHVQTEPVKFFKNASTQTDKEITKSSEVGVLPKPSILISGKGSLVDSSLCVPRFRRVSFASPLSSSQVPSPKYYPAPSI